jgi:hypothetical protein
MPMANATAVATTTEPTPWRMNRRGDQAPRLP